MLRIAGAGAGARNERQGSEDLTKCRRFVCARNMKTRQQRGALEMFPLLATSSFVPSAPEPAGALHHSL